MTDACTKCGSVNVQVETMPDGYVHYGKMVCRDCGYWKWLSKPKNEGKTRRSNNAWYRDKWRDVGPLRCYICGIAEGKTRLTFDIDHVTALEDGGEDVFENTRPICSSCHTIKNSLRSKTREYDKIDQLIKDEGMVPF